MTKTKRQLRAEAVKRLNGMVLGTGSAIKKLAIALGVTWNPNNSPVSMSVLQNTLTDLLTDDCDTECYECARLAELVAENNALRGIVGDLKAPTDPGEASMMSVDAFIKKQTEHESQDTREKINALRAHYGAGPTKITDEQIEAGREAYGAKKELDMVIIDELADTREKLEADVERLIGKIQERIFSGRDAGALRFQMRDLLDRQAAITEREIFDEMPHVRDRLAEQDSAIVEYAEKNAELAAQLESAHAKNRSLKAHIAKMQEGRHGWHVKYPELEKKNAELEAKVDELTAERDSWRYRWHQVRVLMDEPLQCDRATLVDMDGEVVG